MFMVCLKGVIDFKGKIQIKKDKQASYFFQ